MQSFERYLRDHKSIREATPRRGVARPRLTSAGPDEVVTVDYINKGNYRDYTGMLVEVTGSVDLARLGLTELPMVFTSVGRDFDCYSNKLVSLKGAPKKVGGRFDCYDNKLASLKGAPEKVGGDFDCRHNDLVSLEGAPEVVGEDFYCGGNSEEFTKSDVKAVSTVSGTIRA